jgi:hypothetical protein
VGGGAEGGWSFSAIFDTDIVSRKKIIEGEMGEKVGNVSRKVPVRCVQQQQRTSATVRMKNHHAD